MFEFTFYAHVLLFIVSVLLLDYSLNKHVISVYMNIYYNTLLQICCRIQKNYKPDEFVCWFNNSDLHVRHIHWSIMKQKHMYTVTKNSHLCGICNFYIYSTMLTNMKCIGHRLIWNELYQPHAGKQLGLYCDYCNLKPDPITIKLRGYLCL